MMTSWSPVPFQYDKIPLQYLKKNQPWMFHRIFWSISSACRENTMVLFCFEEKKKIYIACFWFVLFFKISSSPGPSDISKRESLHELYTFQLLWCRKLLSVCWVLGFSFLGRRLSIVYRNTEGEKWKKKKKQFPWHLLFCNCTKSGLLLKSDSFFSSD